MVPGKATVFLNVKRGKKGKERGVGGKEGEGTRMIQKEGRKEGKREREIKSEREWTFSSCLKPRSGGWL